MFPITILILTYNEEENITRCLQNVSGWASQVIVIDSYSSDKTVDIVKSFGVKVYQHKFEDYSKQRNWVLDNVKFKNEWVLFLDADEILSSELKSEISQELPLLPKDVSGIEVKRRFYWMGRWIKHGGTYPVWLLRIAKHKKAKWDSRSVNEHMMVDGKVVRFKNDIIHDNKKSIGDWILKHSRYATLEAEELIKYAKGQKDTMAKIKGTQTQRKRWLREKIWNRLPLFVRPFLYFFYCYIIKLGSLDGKAGFVYHILHKFWYRFLIDVKYLEMISKKRTLK